MKTYLEMHFTVNLAFVNYFEDMIEELGKQISLNWMTQEQILSLSLQTFEIDPKIDQCYKNSMRLAIQYKTKRISMIRKKKT